MGRSNVGKSTLIRAILGDVADVNVRISSKPVSLPLFLWFYIISLFHFTIFHQLRLSFFIPKQS